MDQDIFISYSRKDTMIAERICAALDRVGITYFIDRQGIAGGMEFPEVLADAITDCKIFLFLASENSYVSKFTNSEITFAFNEKQPNSILPYIIDGSQLPKKMRFIFSGINWRTIEQHPIDSVLMNDLLQLLGREAANTPRRPTRVPGGLGSDSGTVGVGGGTTSMTQAEIDKTKGAADALYNQKKYSEAYQLYLKAADAGDYWCQFRVAWMANNAEGVTKNVDTARKYYTMSANQGYNYAQYNLGVIYEEEKNYAEAYKWYRKAAAQDHDSAMYWLGVLLRDGKGCSKDEKEAHSWFMKLAAKNDKRALGAVGNDYYYGRGVEVDLPKSVEYYRKAADLGHVYSQYSLGYAYEYGKGVTANLDEAKRWYRKAADGGNESARKALERLKSGNASDPLSTMTEGQLIDKANSLYNAKDYAEAYRYYQASVDRFPNASVWLRMGVMCEDGLGVTVDINKAKHFYELAGEKNNAQAWVYLGHLYYNGKISRDYSLAEKYYQKADALGDAAGAAWTGVLYHYALGRPADKAKARQYYDKAISRGSKFAEEQKAKL